MASHSTSPNFPGARNLEDGNVARRKDPERHDGRSRRTLEDEPAGPQDLSPQDQVAGADSAWDPVLQEIVQHARLATGATGAFIGVVQADQFVCRTRSGSNVGEFISYLNRDGRMVGSCLRGKALQNCPDAQTSQDLDGSVCCYLGARSLVMVPILDGTQEKPVIFGVFSPQADAFSNSAIVSLQSLSGRIADAMAGADRRTPTPSGDAPPPLQVPFSPSSSRRTPQRPVAVTIRISAWALAIVAAVLLAGWTVSRAISQRAPHTAATASEAVSSQAVPVATGVPAPQPVSAPSAPGTVGASVGASPAVVATVKPEGHAVAAVVKAQRPAVTPAVKSAIPARAGQTIPSASQLHVPDLQIENTLDDDSAGSLASRSVGSTKASVPSNINLASQSGNSLQKANSVNAPAVSQASPPHEAVRITRAPDAASAGASSGAAASAASAPAGPIMIPERIALERVSERVEPDYPEALKAQPVPATVTLDVVVGKDGGVEEVRPVNGDSRFLESAVKAMRKWSFAPLLNDGHFVKFESHITLQFALP